MAEGLTVSVRTNADTVGYELLGAASEMRDKALVRALNRTADQVKVQASREMRAAGYNLKASTVKAAMRVQRATASSRRASVIAKGKPIPLIEYSARKTPRGVTVNVLNGRKLIAGAFKATMPSGHTGIFVRVPGGKHRKVGQGSKASWHQLPIRELFGPSVPDGLANEKVQEALQRLIVEKFPAILEHEHAWLRQRARAR